jgi:hypothetical protein
VYLIDPPGPFDTLATWLNHLEVLRRLPADTLLKAEMVKDAEGRSRPLAFPRNPNSQMTIYNLPRPSSASAAARALAA